MRAIFWPKGSMDVYMGYMGSARMIKSVAMENPELAFQFDEMLIQVPGRDLSHARATGAHCQTEAAKVATM